MRTRFDEQLEQLHVELITMGALCEEAITAAMQSLFARDRSLVKVVLEKDGEIDRKEREIETLCMRLLLQQQPVARDLRTISSALKMISDMEASPQYPSGLHCRNQGSGIQRTDGECYQMTGL